MPVQVRPPAPSATGKLTMNFDEYEKRLFSLYAEFAEKVRFIVEQAITATGGLPVLQSIQARAKAPDRLKARLEDAGLLESQSIQDERKDLAGVRLIFYTNTDVDRFLSSRLIFENFEIDQQATKIHHPTKENEGTRYQAIHYVVRLKDERTKLPEYAKFKGLRCEIQIQTILNHAWSETSHDIVYKDRPRDGFGTKAMETITKRFNNIMDKYLMPAGYEFQRVQHDYERLQQGKALFDRDAIASLTSTNSNNERYDLLVSLKDDALPNYDDIAAIYDDLRRPLLETARKARSTPVEPIETPFGNLQGKTSADVLRIIVEIFDHLRYVNVEETFNALCELFESESDADVRKQILDAVKRLAEYELTAWRQVGPQIQLLLANIVSQMDPDKQARLRPLIITVWQELLAGDLSGTTWSAGSVTLHSGALPVSDALKQIRTLAIEGLFALFKSAKTDGSKQEIFSALDAATQLPNQAEYSNELLALTLENAKQIVDFYIEISGSLSYELLEHLEHSLLWDYRRNRQLTEDEGGRFNCQTQAKALRSAIEAFRDRINADKELVRYKTLVGFESVFPQHWTDDEFDYQGVEEYRKSQVDAFVESITSENEAEWLAFMERCAATKSNDLATFPTFGTFVVALAKAKPAIVEWMLTSANADLLNFLPGFLDGLAQSGDAGVYQRIVTKFLDQAAQLTALARHWRNSKPTNPLQITEVLKKAIIAKDDIAVIECLLFAMEVARTDKAPPESDFFRPALEYLTENNDSRWVRGAWFLRTTAGFFEHLTDADAALLLQNLVSLPRIGHEAERLLGLIAERHLQAVWKYFGDRLTHETSKGEDEKYEAVPYSFHGLEKQLSRDAGLAVSSGREWFSRDNKLFRFRGGRLLSAAFPHCTEEFAQALASLVANGNDIDADFVLGIMQNYRGEPATHEVLKQIVARYPQDESKLSRVRISFDNTGVVSGEFGMVEAYRAKKQAILTWTSDERPEVRQFAELHAAELDRRIISEQKRADEDIEMRRRRFETDDDAKDDDKDEN
jgi:ppGpp synthetase/RelA/SpoT-type nucleotidyltranferase